ncbi:MAG: hypothetical protein WA180_22155, partial [Candidatus Sulfotelmatobacter sp.]
YLPGITIPGQGTHNIVYVATMHDSVFAFDADSGNTAPLWMTSILRYSPAGATTVPATVKKCSGTTGWTELGIISTPVIDPSTGTLYLVAETYENGDVVHRLHALDVASGQEKFGGPTTIAASYTLNGATSTFLDLYEMNRPGLLLVNGNVYVGFGSNGCNDYSQGWVMSYNAATLQPEGAYDTEPGSTLASIWQKGAGISADSNGYIYAETGEGYYVPGSNLSTSVLKLGQIGSTLSLADWFTPLNHKILSADDLDLAEGILILPDQPGPFPHEMVAVGKQGTVYVLNRDNLGQLCSTCTTIDSQIVQELPLAVGFESGTPVYWNNTVYFTGTGVSVMGYTLNNGYLLVPPSVQSVKLTGGQHGLVTANGNSNGIFWFNSGNNLWALDAVSLKTLYTSSQAANGRDKLPLLAHFATPVAADGKVFIGTQNSLVVYGLFQTLSVTGGSGQSATVASTLPVPLQVQAVDPYSQNGIPGVTVTFSDGGKGGSFTPSTVVSDPTGVAPTFYTLPKKSGSYAITASVPSYTVGNFGETALPASASTLVHWSGNNQSTPANQGLPAPVIAQAKDSYGNGVSGVVLSYSDSGAGGTFSATPVTTDSTGLAPAVSYTAPTKYGTLKILVTAAGLPNLTFVETVTPGPAANIVATSGTGQSAPPNTQMAQPLVVKVSDQYGNPVSGVAVTFADGGAGGSFSANPVSTSSSGVASVNYTTSATAGTVTISAAAPGVSAQDAFTLNVQ